MTPVSELRAVDDASLERLFEALVGGGARVVAPRRRGDSVCFEAVSRWAEVETGRIAATSSAKPVVFPRVETVLGFRREGSDVQVEDPPRAFSRTVVFGLRPCEARAFGALAAIFGWEPRDAFFEARRAATTLVTLACSEADDACFCTSTGGGPGDTQGTDALLRRRAGGGFAVERLTERGRALFEAAGELPPLDPGESRLLPLADVPRAFDAAIVRERLDGLFESELWADESLRCLGCGACAFACPACACFDLQDEARRDGSGRRLRCWDSCGLRPFTLHASGHNPRERQSQRWRQRVYHKFSYMPERFGTLGCVGCGKCTRACPVDMNLKEHLAALVGEASPAAVP